PIRLTITFSCLCRQAGIASRKLPMVASAFTHHSNCKAELVGSRKPGFTALDSGFRTYAASNLLHERLLVTHHLPFPVSIRPKFADKHPPEPRCRALRKLHRALIRNERVVRSKWLPLEKLQQVAAKHAVFHFDEYVWLGALAVAIRFHSFEIISQKCGVAVLVPFLV